MSAQSCGSCRHAREVAWPKGKTARLCSCPDGRPGRVVDVYAAGYGSATQGRPIPAWCRWYAARGDGSGRAGSEGQR